MPYAMFGRRGEPWPVVTSVVKIRAADDGHVTEFPANGIDLRIEFALAVVTTGAIVAEIIPIRKFLGLDNAVRNADLLRDANGVIEIAAGDARAVRGHGQGFVAEHQISRLGNHCTINAAGE